MVVGSKIFKGDLHVHSPNSGDDFKEKGVTPEKLILAAKDKGLDFIAITDHNTFNYAQLIPYIKEGKKHNITVFPGLELDVEEGRKGIHVICIFDTELDKKLFDEISGELSLHKILRKSISGYQRGFAKLRETITQYDGLLIAAHVNHPDKGFIKNVEGAHKKSKFDSAQFDAMENAKNPVLFDGSDKWFAKKTACIESSDAHSLKEIGTKYSYYKMDKPTIQNLRKGLNDPDMRIFNEIPLEFTHFWIEELTVDSRDGSKGYLHGVCMKFNPNLNCLIGGRGAGKSMVLEAIGYALEIDVKAYEKYRSLAKYDKIIRHAIGERGSVSLLVNYQNIKYKIQRSFGLSSTIWCNDEKVYDHNRPEFPYVFQSQNQITTITDEEEIYSRFLDSLGATAEIRYLKNLISAKIDQLRTNRYEIYEKQQKIDDFVGVKDEYDTIKENIKRLSKTITKYTNNKDSAAYFEKISNSLKSKLIEYVEQLNNQRKCRDSVITLIIDIANNDKDTKNSSFIDYNILLSHVIDELNILSHQEQTHKVRIEIFHGMINTLNESILDIFDCENKEIHKSLPPEDRDIVIDCSAHYDKQDQLHPKIIKLEQFEQQLKDLKCFRVDIQKELNIHVKNLALTRKYLMKKINDKNDNVHIKIKEKADTSPFSRHLKDILASSGSLYKHLENIAKNMTINEFKDAIESDKTPDIVGKRITGGQMVTKRTWGTLKQRFKNNEIEKLGLDEVILNDWFDIRFREDGVRNFKSISNCSVGQRNTAFLEILISLPETTLLIDQPEDELDQTFIFSCLIRAIRREKNQRQIIVPTHNANIPVSGDAEYIYYLQNDNEKLKISDQGSIDANVIIDKIQCSMEGGELAFKKRAQKYGYNIKRGIKK